MYLRMKNVNVDYNGSLALKNINLFINQGEIIAILGANGAGKTTVLRSITGLKTINSGEIWLNNQRIDKLPCHKRVAMGINMVPEERHIYPYMSVKDNLKMGSFLISNNEQKTKMLEKIYGIFPILKKRTSQMGGSLSGGEQQMLTLARCLMSHPKLILLDEPSLGLAPVVVMEILKIVKQLNQEEGVSIILVEQNTKIALDIASRAYILEVGAIAIEGATQKLKNNDIVKEVYLGC